MIAGWHVTPTSNLSGIEREGLEPRTGERSAEAGEGRDAVYLFPTLADLDCALSNWLGDIFGEDETLALLRVEVPDGAEVWTDVGYEIRVGSHIPADRIVVASRNLDEVVDLESEFGLESGFEALGRAAA